jgi:hypothetical protein
MTEWGLNQIRRGYQARSRIFTGLQPLSDTPTERIVASMCRSSRVNQDVSRTTFLVVSKDGMQARCYSCVALNTVMSCIISNASFFTTVKPSAFSFFLCSYQHIIRKASSGSRECTKTRASPSLLQTLIHAKGRNPKDGQIRRLDGLAKEVRHLPATAPLPLLLLPVPLQHGPQAPTEDVRPALVQPRRVHPLHCQSHIPK